jgi:hypothetical protein
MDRAFFIRRENSEGGHGGEWLWDEIEEPELSVSVSIIRSVPWDTVVCVSLRQ